ncbi:tetratricopeptide repeat protein [Catellatospora sp. TT07R-123]|uniref:tetratricopeptide repeat protein n=1 Tax=Catellatospora sp. TT07R-123 TaxID=2733863 RepID=UPI001BB419C4|nr:tetratricopeptide repeat protein [Catellatospora sp. TT07R-123]
MLSVLSPDGTSRRLLVEGESGLGLSGGVLAALEVLAGWSLVTLSGSVDGGQDRVVVSVHRLTARIVRLLGRRPDATVPASVAVEVAAEFLGVLSAGLPLSQVALRRTEVDELVAHVRAIRDNTVGEPSALLLAQADWAAQSLRGAGDAAGSVVMLEANLTDRVRVLGSNHPETLSNRHNLATAYRGAGRVGEAIDLYKLVLTDHPAAIRRRPPGDAPHPPESRRCLPSSGSGGRCDRPV